MMLILQNDLETV